MDTLVTWLTRWNVPPQALRELCALVLDVENSEGKAESEAMVQSRVRLEAAQKGKFLFRNNRGAGKLENGQFIRWGLANDSKRIGDVWKAGDLIGFDPTLITEEMVGTVIAKFFSVECKRSDWKFSGDAEDIAQVQWATLVNANGGCALIVNRSGVL